MREHGAGDELGRAGAGHQHRTNHGVSGGDFLGKRLAGREAGADAAVKQIVESAQARQGTVKDGDFGAEADSHAGRLRADNSTTDDGDLAGGNARHATKQHATAAIGLLQGRRRGLDGEAAGNLAHGRKQRQMAVRVGDRLIGDGGHARGHQTARLGRIGGKVKIGEEDLSGAELRPFLRLRLLDLDDHVGLGEDPLGGLGDAGAGLDIGRVVGADAGPGAGLDQHIMAVRDVFANGTRRQTDAGLGNLDFPGDPDEHGDLRDRLEFICTPYPLFRCVSVISWVSLRAILH